MRRIFTFLVLVLNVTSTCRGSVALSQGAQCYQGDSRLLALAAECKMECNRQGLFKQAVRPTSGQRSCKAAFVLSRMCIRNPTASNCRRDIGLGVSQNSRMSLQESSNLVPWFRRSRLLALFASQKGSDTNGIWNCEERCEETAVCPQGNTSKPQLIQHEQSDWNNDLKGKGRAAARSGSLYSIAVQHERRRNYSAARRIFKLLLSSYARGEEATDGRVFLAWGKMEAKLDHSWAMRKAFATGLELIPDNTHIPHAWAIEELKVGNVEAARKLFHFALERDPYDGLVYQSFALLEQQQGNIDKARELLEEGTRMDPTNVFLWSACGVFESRQGNLKEAANMFQQASVLGPKHCQTWQAYGVLLEKMGRTEEAAEKFERALEIDPSSVPTLQAYGLMEARRCNYDPARKFFQRGIELDASHAPIFHAWARMEEEQGNYGKARELFNSGVASAPDSVALLKAWAMMELQLGHIDGSNRWYVSKNMGLSRLLKITERLEMLRLLIEQRSEDDLKLVMEWIEEQRNQQLQTEVSKMLSVGTPVPIEWEEGRHFSFDSSHEFNIGDLVVVQTRGPGEKEKTGRSRGHLVRNGGLCFGRVIALTFRDKRNDAVDLGESAGWNRKAIREGRMVLVHVRTKKADALERLTLREEKCNEKSELKVVRRCDGEDVGLNDSVVTAQWCASEVGKLLFTRAELVDSLRVKYGQEGLTGFNLHAEREGDRLRLKVLMERYGEDYITLNLPAWISKVDEEAACVNGEEGQSPGIFGTQHDSVLQQWVHRRSDDDVMAFRKWFNDMYQRDPGVGMKMLDWKMPSIWDLPDPHFASAPRVPTEWSRLGDATQRSSTTGYGFEEQPGQGRLRGAAFHLRRLLQKQFGVDVEMIRIAELCLAVGIFSAGLMFGPSFAREWIQHGPERDPDAARPQLLPPPNFGGVDAYLLQTGIMVSCCHQLARSTSFPPRVW